MITLKECSIKIIISGGQRLVKIFKENGYKIEILDVSSWVSILEQDIESRIYSYPSKWDIIATSHIKAKCGGMDILLKPCSDKLLCDMTDQGMTFTTHFTIISA